MKEVIVHAAEAEHAISGRTNPAAAIRRLGELAKESQANVYERVRLTAELLDNYAWMEERFGGSEARAVEWLTREFWPVLAGLVDIYDLADAYRMFPEKEWHDCGYDLQTMVEKYECHRETERRKEKRTRPAAGAHAKEKARPATEPRRKKSVASGDGAPLPLEVREALHELSLPIDAAVEKLRKENARLRQENAALLTRLETLESR